jgi:condensin complex subunit 3
VPTSSITLSLEVCLTCYQTHARTHLLIAEDYWSNLTPERAFLARVFIEHCVNTKDNDRLEAALPVVTLLAFRIQQEYNKLLELLRQLEEHNIAVMENEDEKKDVQLEEQAIDAELILGELLGLAVNLDYADEIGRRKMFQLIRRSFIQHVLQ